MSELRTKGTRLVNDLKAGKSVYLLHRSKVIAAITPQTDKTKLFDAAKVDKIAKSLNLKEMSYKERDRIYRAYLEKRYGAGIS